MAMHKLIFQIQALCFIMRSTSQYSHSKRNELNQQPYSDEDNIHRSYVKHRKHSGKRFPRSYYDYSSECECSCLICVEKKECCEDFCNECDPSEVGLFMVPYPYPMLVPSVVIQTATSKTTVTSPRTTSTAPIYVRRSNARTYFNYESELPDNMPYVASYPETRRLLPNTPRPYNKWVPKYAMLPIPDGMADSLMLQVRKNKVKQFQDVRNVKSMEQYDTYEYSIRQ